MSNQDIITTIISEPSITTTVTPAAEIIVEVIGSGPQGIQGETGLQGPQGIQGIQGEKGEKGDIGPQGEVGPQGIQGPKGDTGYTPIKGIDYFDGEQGPQGIQGIQGPQGEIGPKGEVGPQGPQGLQGEAGPKGDNGESITGVIDNGDGTLTITYGDGSTLTTANLTGPKGDTGPQGEIGPQGDQANLTYENIIAAIGFTPENTSAKAIPNGYASLDTGGKVPSEQLPSYVDDVVEYANFAALPVTGESGKIYITLDTGKVYRWSTTIYVEIVSGEVTSVNGKKGIVTLAATDIGAEPTIGTKGTAFNKNYGTTSTDVKMNGTQAVGTVDAIARIDHVHPTDTTRAPLNDPGLTGTPTAPTAAVGTNTTQLATTAFVNAEIANDAAPIGHVGATGSAHGIATLSVNGFMSSTDKTKIDSIESGAEVNNISDINALDLTDGGDSSLHYHSTDRNRANHTGTQLASTISDFDTEVANNTTVAANTAARHTHTNKTILDNTTASFTTADETKLDGIEAGAQVNVGTNIAQGTRTTTTVPITSSTGTDATLAAATTSLAGVMSSADKTKLDGIATGAEVNQNAFSNILVGATTVAADAKTDTLELIAGTGITITPDAANDKITIASTGEYTLPVAGAAVLGGVLSGTDITVDASGNVSVVDDSHNHITANIDGLDTALSGKSDTTHNHTIDSLSNTTITSNSSGEILKWNGTAWVNNTLAEAGIAASGHTHNTFDNSTALTGANVYSNISVTDGIVTGLTSRALSAADIGASASTHNHSLDSLSNVTITTNSDGELLVWDSTTSKWINQTLSEAGVAASNHTQTASTITDFDTEVSNNTDVAANTTARHSHTNKAVLDNTTASFTIADESKLDGIAINANNYTHPANHPASIIIQDVNNRFVTDAEKTTWNGKASTAIATTLSNGLMSGTDKAKLNGVEEGANNYVLPTASNTVIGGVKIGANLSIQDGVLSADSSYTLPVATSTTLGGIKVGDGLSIQDGVLSADNASAIFAFRQEKFIATAGQTVFNLTKGSYQPNTSRIFWYWNRIKQDNSTLIESSSTSFTILSNAVLEGDEIIVEYVDVMDLSLTPYPTHAPEHLPGGADAIPLVTHSSCGLMSDLDKVKLDGLENRTINGKQFSTDITLSQKDIGGIEVILKTASFNLDLSDNYSLQKCLSASNIVVTIPLNSKVPFPVGSEIVILRYGDGAVQIAPEDGVVLLASNSNTIIRSKYDFATIKQLAIDEWILLGSLSK